MAGRCTPCTALVEEPMCIDRDHGDRFTYYVLDYVRYGEVMVLPKTISTEMAVSQGYGLLVCVESTAFR
jgi:hypothetical protein